MPNNENRVLPAEGISAFGLPADIYTSIFEYSTVGIAVVTKEGRFYQTNPALCAMLGYSASELAALTFNDITYPDDQSSGGAFLSEALSGRAESIRLEKRYIRKDGSVFWAEVSSVVFRDASGAFRYLIAHILDISAARKTQLALEDHQRILDDMLRERSEQLRASEQLNQGLFEKINSMIMYVDRQTGAIVAANSAACSFYGYSLEQITRLSILDISLLGPEETKQRLRKIAEGELTQLRNRHRLADGSVREVEIYIGKNQYQGRDVNLCVIQDITAQLRYEEELRRSEARFRLLFENMQEGVLLIDIDWRYLYINRAAEQQGRRPKEELLGRTVMDCWPGFESTDYFKLQRQVMTERIPARVEGPFIFPDGEEHWFEWRIQPAEEGLLIITVDVTERKRAEQALRESDRFQQATFNALKAHICVLNQSGEIVAVNRAWNTYASSNNAQMALVGSGNNYLAACDGVPSDSPDAEIAYACAKGIRSVITGAVDSFEMEYPCDSPEIARWFNMRVNRFEGQGPVYVTVTHTDVTKLKEAEARLSRFFNLVPDMVCIASTDGFFKELNSAWERCLGYTRSELLLRPMVEFMHPDDREATFREVERQSQGNETIQFINRYLAKDGSYRWLEWYASPSPDGSTLYAAARDITEDKIAKDELRQSREELLKFASQVPGMLYQFDVYPDGAMRVPFCSGGIRDVFDLTPEDVLDDFTPMAQRIYPDDVNKLGKLIQESVRSFQPYQDVFRVAVPGRPMRWAWSKSIPEPLDGGGVRFHGLLIDITERILAEQALRDSEARFASMIQVSPVGIFIFSRRSGQVLDCNEACSQLTGYTRGELLKRTVDELDLFDKQNVLGPWYQALEAHENFRDVQMTLQKKSGELRYVNLSVAQFESQGEMLAIVLCADVTELKRVEASLLLAQTELESRVQERTAELNVTNLALEKAVQAKNEFMAAMSHELRTPLSEILGLSEAIGSHVYGPLNEKQSRGVRSIYQSGERLLKIINDVIDYTRLQSGDMDIRPSYGLLAHTCALSIQAVQDKARAKGQDLVFSGGQNIVVYADELRLKQVLINLLDNAVKFTAAGGRVELRLESTEKTQEVLISVIDTGIGIQADAMSRLFKPFVQLDARLSRVYEGTGLGLALVKGLVELMGGTIRVESEFGHGSCFTVVLPTAGSGKQTV